MAQNLASPEACLGSGAEALRRLTWRTVYRGSCYYLTLTVSQRFARSQLALNGCVLEMRKHSMLAQVHVVVPPSAGSAHARSAQTWLPALIGCTQPMHAHPAGLAAHVMRPVLGIPPPGIAT